MTNMPLLTRTAEYRILQALGENCGIVLTDSESGACVFRFRQDWADFAGEEAAVLAALAGELPARHAEMGTGAFLRWIDETLSNTLRVEPPVRTFCSDLERTAQAIYRKHVRSTVNRYRTHLPYYKDIDLAAGGLGQDKASRTAEWIEARLPGRRNLSEDLFVVRVHGHSMEPDIPDGALCVFRSYYGGSRKNGVYIVQRIATMDEGGEFTLKRYSSSKKAVGDSWKHGDIHMHPDNPEFPDWKLSQEEDRYITIAEFLNVLEDPQE